MKIAIIGAGIAGLAAGRELANAGHEVVVFEKSNGFGGRLATRYAGKDLDVKLDHGISYLEASTPAFQKFLVELMDRDLVKEWRGKFVFRDSHGKVSALDKKEAFYIAPEGLNSVGKFLSRYMDVRRGSKVSGLTHIGEDRRKKRTWMLNFPTSETEGVDAVIIGTPSKQAYAILNTTIDEVETLKLVREIDEVEYHPQFALIAGYGDTELPEWNAMRCEDEVISWISNETTKRETGESALVIHSSYDFARKNLEEDPQKVQDMMLDKLSELLGGWAGLPEWSQLQRWKYSRVINPLPHDFMEIQGNDSPLALVGSYMNGNDVESAYLSGIKLGKHWVKKYSE
ncbi:NAD(P)/FAD-dependent oxidoreductase [Balneola sp. MJW-20]|uniref:NAD(P)/FAD-dependent oxidoreductase n=1 Tax=Gracilimonas aurantiaca TaxID=3234185 RepID=UPI0034669E87